MQRFLTIREIDQLLPISSATIYREIHAGNLASLKIGGKYLIPAKALAQLEALASGNTPEVSETRTLSPTGQPFLGIAQAAKLLRVSRWILSREINEGRFPAVSLGGRSLIAGKAIDALEHEALESGTLVDVADFTAARTWRNAA